MKRLIKIFLLVLILAILTFSQNTTIVKARTFVVEKVKIIVGKTKPVYEKADVDKYVDKTVKASEDAIETITTK